MWRRIIVIIFCCRNTWKSLEASAIVLSFTPFSWWQLILIFYVLYAHSWRFNDGCRVACKSLPNKSASTYNSSVFTRNMNCTAYVNGKGVCVKASEASEIRTSQREWKKRSVSYALSLSVFCYVWKLHSYLKIWKRFSDYTIDTANVLLFFFFLPSQLLSPSSA